MPAEPTFSNILVRATNWVGDAVICLPALQALRCRFPKARITILARPWVADIYEREPFADRVLPLNSGRGAADWNGKWRAAGELRSQHFDCAILMQNAFEAALLVRLAGIPRRVGYNRDGRGFLLTDPIPVPRPGEIPNHQRFYYLEMLRRAGLTEVVGSDAIRLDGAALAREKGAKRFSELGLSDKVIGISPGAAFGGAKRWLPNRFAEAASRLAAQLGAAVALFGSSSERALCESIAASLSEQKVQVHNFAGVTSLREFIDLAAACHLYLTNDSGAMHISSALGVPTVAIFGATDDNATGPTGPHACVVREPVECSPCLLRECPIDHRCMTRISVDRVVDVAVNLIHAT
jgi:heptosyltransferase-2